jgi:diguanylate cyclase (GGDEF)-like protein
VNTPTRAEFARTPREREQLAKDWLLRMIERTPLPEVSDLPVSWIVAEAPPLIADIVAALADPAAALDRELEPAERERAAQLARLRDGPGAPEQIPRDLAALQALLVETIRREIPERRPGDFAQAVERLAEVFGSIQGAVASSLVEERSGGARVDELTGLPGPVQLDEWLRILLAEQRRYGHGFSVMLVDVDGLGLNNEAYGRESGDRLLTAVAGVIRRQIRGVDQAFRLPGSEFCVLCPHQDATSLVSMAERMASLVEGSQAAEGPRIAVAIGIAACPDDGEEAELLLEAAQQATYAAKAAGRHVGTGPNGPEPIVQDR